MVDKEFIISTLQDLVRIDSVNPKLDAKGGGEKEIARYIAKALSDLGLAVELDELETGRYNVIATLKGSGTGPSLMLNAHTDTVGTAGMEEPFSAKMENGKLYGRGAYDMKASIAAIMGVAKAIKTQNMQLQGDLVMTFVADEEFESIGSEAIVKKLKTDAAIVTEPSDLHICLAHKGFAIYKITSFGKAAHGGNHHIGKDANTMMGLLLAKIHEYAQELKNRPEHPLCGQASAHVPMINGGNSLFIYADSCSIMLERRTLPGESKTQVDAEIESLIEQVKSEHPEFEAQLESVIWRNPYEIKQEEAIVQKLLKAAQTHTTFPEGFIGHNWWEDSAIFGEAGIKTVIIGPKGGGIHEAVEWVEIDSVIDLSDILLKTAIDFCLISD